jgi:putative hydrolase of the HAD superfamily
VRRLPLAEIDALFVDVGNTLVAMDLDWVSEHLAEQGLRAPAATLRRAEAAARPVVSRIAAERRTTEGEELFALYLHAVLDGVAEARELDTASRRGLVERMAPLLRGPGRTQRLWSQVLPGVREALAQIRAAGLPLVAVSNSDGSCEAGLVEQGLRDLLDHVLDSAVVGFEKPDARIFERALELSGSPPARTLHVGDFYGADVVGARRAGIHPVLLDPYDDWGEVDCARAPDFPSLVRTLLSARR